MKTKHFTLLSSLVLLPAVAAGIWFYSESAKAASDPPQKLMDYVDMQRYGGVWYEIARFPNLFQPVEHLAGTDTYEFLPNGDIKVTYGWREKSVDGPPKKMEGKAWIDDRKTNAKLKVQFFWPIAADYWILEVGPEYEYTVIGYPDRSLLWIMARTPTLPEDTYNGILERLKAQGYDTGKLVKIPQPPDAPRQYPPDLQKVSE
jgi:apolipoprotein D and lipocalin family protein